MTKAKKDIPRALPSGFSRDSARSGAPAVQALSIRHTWELTREATVSQMEKLLLSRYDRRKPAHSVAGTINDMYHRRRKPGLSASKNAPGSNSEDPRASAWVLALSKGIDYTCYLRTSMRSEVPELSSIQGIADSVTVRLLATEDSLSPKKMPASLALISPTGRRNFSVMKSPRIPTLGDGKRRGLIFFLP